MKKLFRRAAIGTACLSRFTLACPPAQAQTSALGAAPTLKEITVTGNPLGAADLMAPAVTARLGKFTGPNLKPKPQPMGLRTNTVMITMG